MPLHDWTDDGLWENFHYCWVFRLGEWLRGVLPPGYRVYTGSFGRAGLAGPAEPDVAVSHSPATLSPTAAFVVEPDEELAVATIEPELTLMVQRGNRVVAVIEVVSPANKRGDARRDDTTRRYSSYLRGGVHLMLIDTLPRPAGHSLADSIAGALELPNQPALPPPAISVYRVSRTSEPCRVAVWRRLLAVGQPLPMLPLPLTLDLQVPVDLETTYTRAAEDSYLT